MNISEVYTLCNKGFVIARQIGISNQRMKRSFIANLNLISTSLGNAIPHYRKCRVYQKYFDENECLQHFRFTGDYRLPLATEIWYCKFYRDENSIFRNVSIWDVLEVLISLKEILSKVEGSVFGSQRHLPHIT